MGKWPFLSREEVILGNLEATVGITTLWSPRKMFVEMYLEPVMSKIAIVGNMYAIFGIGIMIRNYLANPRLRYLIVTGNATDKMGKSKEALEWLGSDPAGFAKKFHLTPDQLNRFLRQTKIFFVNEKEVTEFIGQELYRDLAHEKISGFEAIEVLLPKPEITVFPAADSSHSIRVRTIAEGYQKLLQEIRLFGHLTGKDSEGHVRQELWELNIAITDQNPLTFDSIPHPEHGAPEIEKYCKDFWGGTEPEDLAYRYGWIVRKKYGDQVKAAIEAFKQKAETFRVVISLWDPDTNTGSIVADDPPCLTVMQLRIVDGKFHLWAYIRTNDMFNAWTLNAMMLRYFQHMFLEELRVALNKPDIRLGELNVTSGSAHIYDRDFSQIESVIAEKNFGFLPDPKGNFQISVKNGKIIVSHYHPDGEQLIQEFVGTSAVELSRRVLPFVSQKQNAMYIGRELMKAELQLKDGR